MRNSPTFAALGLALAACLIGCGHEPETPAAKVEAPLEVPRLDGGAGASSGDEPGAGVIRFGRESAKAGDRAHLHVRAVSEWEGQTSSYESELLTEVLAVETGGGGAWPSRVKVEFRKNEHFDNASVQPTSVAGHTYLVDTNPAQVLDARTQAAPSADEIMRVTDVLPDLGMRTQIDQMLPDTAMRIGERRDDIARAIARILHPRVWSVDQGTAALVRADRKTGTEREGDAVFHVTLDATSSATSMRISLKGEARVRLRDARLQEFVLSGDFVRANGEKGTLHVERHVRDD